MASKIKLIAAVFSAVILSFSIGCSKPKLESKIIESNTIKAAESIENMAVAKKFMKEDYVDFNKLSKKEQKKVIELYKSCEELNGKDYVFPIKIENYQASVDSKTLYHQLMEPYASNDMRKYNSSFDRIEESNSKLHNSE